MSSWEEIEDSLQRGLAVIAAITNMFLLHLILHKSPKKFGAYKYLMVYISVFEIIYAVDDVLIVPQLFTHGSAYLVIIDSDTTMLSPSLIPYFDILYCVSFGMSMAIFAVHFVFRYLVVIGNSTWTTDKSPRLLVWFLVPIAFGLVWSAICQVFLGPNEFMDKWIKDNMVKYSTVNIEKDYYIGFYFYPKGPDGLEVMNWWNMIGTFLVTMIMLISSFVMFFFGYKCYKEIKGFTDLSTKSKKFRSIQRQLFNALAFQTVIPLALMHIPASVLFLTCFANCSFELLGRMLTVSIAMYPAVDPFPNMLIIIDYRNAIFQYMAKLRCFSLTNCLTNKKEDESTAVARAQCGV